MAVRKKPKAKAGKEKKSSLTGLEVMMARINKKYGTHSILKASAAKPLERVRRIRTGMFSLDIAMGGGVPVDGKIVHIWGGESSGKSVLSLRIAGAFQRHCRVCGKPMSTWDELTMTATPMQCCVYSDPMKVVWFDAERSWSNPWSRRLGVDCDEAFIIRTEYAEQGIDIAEAVIRSGHCDLLVVDSVAALTPSVEIKGEAGDTHVSPHARLMNYAMRVWTSAQSAGGMADVRRCTVILINQVRMKIGGYGSPETQPGGRGMKFHAHIEFRIKRKGVIEEDDMPVGHALEAACVKNKTAPPLRTAAMKFRFKAGDNQAVGSTNFAEQVLHEACKWGLVKLDGSWYTLGKGVRIHGADTASAFLRQPDQRPLLNLLADKVWECEVDWLAGV